MSTLSKRTHQLHHHWHAQIKKLGLSRELMVYPMGCTVNGWYGAHALLAPPFIANKAYTALVVERLVAAINAANAGGLVSTVADPVT